MFPKITVVIHGQNEANGDYYHRTLWPYQALAEHTHVEIVQMMHPDVYLLASRAELLIVQMIADEGLLEVIQHRKKHGRPTITEISDDFMNFPSTTQLYHFYSEATNQNKLKKGMQYADGVQFSSPFLEKKYSSHNDNHHVFMNQLWEVNLPDKKTKQDPLHLGWVGSGGHVLDAEELVSFLIQCSALENFTFSVMTTSTIAAIFKNAGIDVHHQPTGDFNEYLSFISSLDVGMAHVLEEDFALGRSDGKYLEYITQGVVSVCSKRGTFEHTIRNEENGFVYENAEELQRILHRISSSPELIDDIREKAYKDVQENRNHRKAVQEKLSWYQSFHKGSQEHTPLLEFVKHEIEDELKKLLEEHNYVPDPSLLPRYKAIAKKCPTANFVWQGLRLLAMQFGWNKEFRIFERMEKDTYKKALQSALDVT